MCKKCADAVQEIFPEVPKGEYGDFLMGTTCYPFGDHEQVRVQLLDNRKRMTTDDWKECYAIADADMDEAMKKMREKEAEEGNKQ